MPLHAKFVIRGYRKMEVKMLRIILFFVITSCLMTFTAYAVETDECDALFVIRADNVTFNDNHMVLKGVDRNITYFCDRPVRSAGHLTIEALDEIVTRGQNNFLKNPPNAAVSIFDQEKSITDIVVKLPSAPKVCADVLDFEIRVIEGKLPAKGGKVVLFVDPIGVPISPHSVAGVHRRHERREERRD